MSFADSLNKTKMAQVATLSMPEVAMANEPAIMTLSAEESLIPAYDPSNEIMTVEENWKKPSNSHLYDYYDGEYADDKFSEVDENKNITLADGQINLTQEKNSQYIPFQMNRKYDGFDLSETEISFYWVNRLGAGSTALPVDVYYNEETDKIKFAWLVDDDVTMLAGDIEFEIHAEGTNSKGYGYLWKTKSNKLNVIQALEIQSFIEPDDTWQESFIEKVSAQANKAEQANTQAQAALTEIRQIVNGLEDGLTEEVQNIVNENYYTKTQTEEYIKGRINEIPQPDLSNYALKEELPTIPTNVSAFTNDAGYLTEHQSLDGYALKSEIPSIDGLASEQYVKDAIDAIPEVDLSNYALKEELPKNLSELTNDSGFVTGTFVQEEIAKVDISDELGNLVDPEGNKLTVEAFVKQEVDAVDVSDQLVGYAKEADVYKKEETYTKTEVDTAVKNVKVDLTGYATEEFVKQETNPINTAITNINETLESIDKSPKTRYRATYGDVELSDGSIANYMFTLWKEENGVEEVQDRFQIAGGGGNASSVSMIISYLDECPQYPVFTVNDDVMIKYKYEGIDSAGDYVGGMASWKIGNKVILKEEISSGENSVNLTDYISVGDTKVSLFVEHETGASASKTWTIKVVDLTIKSSFDNTKHYPANNDIEFSFIPTGSVDKTVHFNLAGKEIGTKLNSSAAAGRTDYFVLPAQAHGAYLLDVYMTADINGKTVPSNHLYKDIVWFDQSSTIPVIGCDTHVIETTQYNSVNIKYTVFDPSTETPEVTWYLGDEVLSTEVLTEKDENGYYTYSYKASESGSFELKVVCGDSEPKIITINASELDIDISPVLSGLAFDFDPTPSDYSNSSENKLWSDKNTGVKMTVSDNFDWVNGGYQLDDKGDKYFCVKAGTRATIDYNLFGDAAQTNGKEFKIIFRTKNIRQRDTSFLTCMNDGIGLDMKVEHASIHSSGGTLKSLYCEDAIIEYEFNIDKSSDKMIVMTYEDGTPNIPYEYTDTTSFRQLTAQPITIGSDDCDIHIYRMKAYTTSLTDEDIKNNFIADARNAEDMIDRYNRNQIYNEDGKIVSTSANGDFNADAVMKAAPELRYIFLEVPHFTTGKESKIDGCTTYFRYPAGKRPVDNWNCTGMRHRGQGTSSDSYGPSGRNIDLVMDRSTSVFTWTDENGEIVESSTITLTDTSFPTDYLNIKLNIASSENANNAEMARRFNQFQPFLRYIRKKDSRIKDTMEFYNCVVFIRETDEDLTTHTEFADRDWHFYGIGNVGDSKKTDDTRVNNANDPREFVVELMDVDKPLSSFPTGKDNNETCPVNEWKEGNSAYDVLYSQDYVYDEDGKFESFAGTTFEFRYEMDGITEEQRETNINVWRDFYTFLAISTDEEIYANLKKYFVIDSALYYYLFTERYTMVDNRAKNSFWHYGKVYISNAEAAELGDTEASYYIIDDEMAAFNDGYRFDLNFFYDADTSLGIDNTGNLVFSYGKEDTDRYVDGDPTSKEVFRVSNSRFFCKIRDLFTVELEALYKNRETAQAWNSQSLINQWDASQALFPEELWRLDFKRKYERPYLGISVDNSIVTGVYTTYLIGKFFGRKKYQRRQYETNQEIYYATRYFGNKAKNDQIWFRGNAPEGVAITPNYSLTITPYSDMYVCVQYTSTGTPIHKRVKAGQPCTFINNSQTMDFMYIWAASYIQEIDDLSRCYIDDNDFTPGIRLRRLVLGSAEEGYDNPFMKEFSAKNNPLLEYLDLRNISGLNSDLVLNSCSNLKELYAEGTNATGAIFANGGLLETAHLPAVNSLLMKNLSHIKDFTIESYDNLKILTIENCNGINSYIIVDSSKNLQELRLVGIDWNLEDNNILERAFLMWGRDGSNAQIDQSVLTGNVYVPGIKQYDLYKYQETWSDLEISYGAMTPQFVVTFVNDDGTVLDVQYVDIYGDAVDPVARIDNPIDTPIKASTISTSYTFTGWDKTFTNVGNNITVMAVYKETTRQYSVKYVQTFGNITTELQPARMVDYGTYCFYEGDTPTYTAEEQYSKFYLFNRWDKSGYVDGDKVITAIYDDCYYSNDSYFTGRTLDSLSPVEIYTLTKLVESGRITVLTDEDGVQYLSGTDIYGGDSYSFNMGHDYNYDDLADKTYLLVDKKEPLVFSGTTYKDTGITMLDMDRDFILAIDYEFASGNTNGATLIDCYDDFNQRGFKVSYTNNPNITWISKSVDCAINTNREMLVLRHIKGEAGLHVYTSNLSGDTVSYVSLNETNFVPTNFSLVFGAKRQDSITFDSYAKGTIHWAKLWYADLGENACRKLAAYIHEENTLKIAGFKRYYLENGQRNSINLIADKVLYTKKSLSSSQSNVNGWSATTLRTWLNSRFYDGIPMQIQQLLKKVMVKSRTNGYIDTLDPTLSTTTTVATFDYIWIPAVSELVNSSPYNIEPYTNEVDGTPKCIKHMTETTRIMKDYTGEAVTYWTRSPSSAGSGTGKGVTYFINIGASGSVNTTGTNSSEQGVVIELAI